MKIPSAGRDPLDISFLAHHEEVVYHPAGSHIAVVGKAKDGSYGIWQATNVGRNPAQVARGESAKLFFSLAYSTSGELVFAADHGDHVDVHRVREDGWLETVATEDHIGQVVVSPFNGYVAYRAGGCGGKATVTRTVEPVEGAKPATVRPAGDGATQPIGWLPNGDLVGFAHEDFNCEPAGDIVVWSLEGEPRTLIRGAAIAAIRAELPEPPPPPGIPGEAEA